MPQIDHDKRKRNERGRDTGPADTWGPKKIAREVGQANKAPPRRATLRALEELAQIGSVAELPPCERWDPVRLR